MNEKQREEAREHILWIDANNLLSNKVLVDWRVAYVNQEGLQAQLDEARACLRTLTEKYIYMNAAGNWACAYCGSWSLMRTELGHYPLCAIVKGETLLEAQDVERSEDFADDE